VCCQELLQKLAGEAIGGDSKTEKLHVLPSDIGIRSKTGLDLVTFHSIQA
jgi:hypothetical protein